MTIRAVFRDGVFRPIVPIAIKEGTEVDIPYEEKQSTPTPEQVKAEVKRILSLPQDNSRSFDGLDHDKILYGEPLSS